MLSLYLYVCWVLVGSDFKIVKITFGSISYHQNYFGKIKKCSSNFRYFSMTNDNITKNYLSNFKYILFQLSLVGNGGWRKRKEKGSFPLLLPLSLVSHFALSIFNCSHPSAIFPQPLSLILSLLISLCFLVKLQNTHTQIAHSIFPSWFHSDHLMLELHRWEFENWTSLGGGSGFFEMGLWNVHQKTLC